MIYFLSSQDIIGIHQRMIVAYGGLAGYADPGRIESMATRILNRHIYEGEDDIYILAAAYLLAIARGHCFNDANKRTAFASTALFLRRNGILLRFSPIHEQLTVSAAQGSLDVWHIAEALKQST
ncbi:type II toxin-antitoxin system death-on-curing family toxin [Erwinia amylovora]|uniref:Death on curing protein n=4 Tax=Erwinia amylovora TaxID=552 RepID=D4I2L7_ERWAC|nr:type II toxin-antitoxin system death-on-curing family toxin [Erwinia amylovora]CBX80644.1 Death on curing protein [Erwinia amylovora ATCC BAA-2158]CDK15261.1 Death on curing protein [Erwinia amylovora LA635]CDK18627.1 Death on curing protein [Erwinia amylovora LA636]CDK21997.1 Death on curing protein [Erwinia amylovora LA637]ATZ11566.1 type II toxin-antitoxin system death-on-curing family toxin [Erwinia amylovora]